MWFVWAILSYIWYLIYNLVSNLLDIVPIWTIFTVLHQFNADSIITSINTIVYNYVINWQSAGVFSYYLAIFALLWLATLILWLAFMWIKYLYGNISDYLFRYKYKGIEDEELSETLNDNILVSENPLDKNKWGISLRKKDLKLAYQWFAGLIVSRVHSWKENKMKLSSNMDGNKVRYFWVLTFTTLYLFWFMNRKELKEFKFANMIFALLAMTVLWLAFFNVTNNYIFNIYKSNISDKVVWDMYIVKNWNSDIDPKVEEVSTNVHVSKFSDMLTYLILSLYNAGSRDNISWKEWINSNFAKQLEEFSNFSDTLEVNVVTALNVVKNDETYKKRFLKEKDIYPDFYSLYVLDKIWKDEFQYFFKKVPLTYSIVHYTQLVGMLSLYGNDNNIISTKIYEFLSSFMETVYKWKEYRSIYKVVNENTSLVTIQKTIYWLGMVPIVNPETLIPLKEAKSSLGMVSSTDTKDMYVNTNPLVWTDETSKTNINEIRKWLKQITNNDDTSKMTVANPNYIYKIFWIFPVYPLSTGKWLNMAYYFFLLILSLVQLFLLIIMLWLGRFIYLYLIYTMLDTNQKSSFEIEWDTEITDLVIRFIVTLSIYIYLVNALMISKII